LVVLSHRLTGTHLTEHRMLSCSVFDALLNSPATLIWIPWRSQVRPCRSRDRFWSPRRRYARQLVNVLGDSSIHSAPLARPATTKVKPEDVASPPHRRKLKLRCPKGVSSR